MEPCYHPTESLTIRSVKNLLNDVHFLIRCTHCGNEWLVTEGFLMKPSATVELAAQFLRYCEEHPQQRFFQALRNWTGYDFVSVYRQRKPPTAAIIENDSFYLPNEAVLVD